MNYLEVPMQKKKFKHKQPVIFHFNSKITAGVIIGSFSKNNVYYYEIVEDDTGKFRTIHEAAIIPPSTEIAVTKECTSSTGTKHDAGKPMCELLSSQALVGTATVLTFGAKKYSAHNWRLGIVWSRLIGSTLRHLFAFAGGEDLDPESGLPHIDHAATNIMFLQEFYRTRKDLDDRFTQPKEQ